MQLKDYILMVCETHQWLTGSEIRTRILEERLTQNDWGPISSIIALLSPEAAKWWFDFMGGDRGVIYVDLYFLSEEGFLEYREQSTTPDGLVILEYRLTNRGSHHRIKMLDGLAMT